MSESTNQGINNNSNILDGDQAKIDEITRSKNEQDIIDEKLADITRKNIDDLHEIQKRPLQIKRVLRQQYKKRRDFVEAVQQSRANFEKDVNLYNTTFQKPGFQETSSV